MIDKVVTWTTKELNKKLKGVISAPIEFKRENNGMMGAFITNDGVQIATYVVIRTYEDAGALFGGEHVFTTNHFCVSTVNHSIPTTVISKKISMGFMKGSKRVFVPFLGPTNDFNAKDIYNNKLNWNPFVERLNQDEKLGSLLKGLPSSKSKYTSSKRSLSISIDDSGERNFQTLCQLIPNGNYTLIAVQYIPPAGFEAKILDVVNVIRRIREHILSYPYDQPTVGQVAQPWATMMLTVFNMVAPQLVANCPQCGAPISPEAIYCTNCGQKVR